MRIPTPEESLAGWKKARTSKTKAFWFCVFGFCVGVMAYEISLLPNYHWAAVDIPLKEFGKVIGIIIMLTYGLAVLFFSLSFFTNIWERICDYKIAKFEKRIASSSGNEN
jgi:hypothetical protein